MGQIYTIAPITTLYTNRAERYDISRKWAEQLSTATRELYEREFKAMLNYYMPELPFDDAVCKFLNSNKHDALSISEEYIKILRDKEYGSSKINAYISAVNSIVKYAYNHDIIQWEFNLIHYRNIPQRDSSGPSKEDMIRIHNELKTHSEALKCQRLYLCVCLWFFCGLRTSETLSLRVDDIDFINKSIAPIRKRDRERTRREITDYVLTVIKEYITANNITSGYIIRSRDGQPITRTALNRDLDRIFHKLGLPKTNPHAFRHAGATLIASNTTSISLLQKYGGWRNIATPIKYMDKVAHEERKTSEMLENIIVS